MKGNIVPKRLKPPNRRLCETRKVKLPICFADPGAGHKTIYVSVGFVRDSSMPIEVSMREVLEAVQVWNLWLLMLASCFLLHSKTALSWISWLNLCPAVNYRMVLLVLAAFCLLLLAKYWKLRMLRSITSNIISSPIAARIIFPFILGLLTSLGHPPGGYLILCTFALGWFFRNWIHLPSVFERFIFGMFFAIGYFAISELWVGTYYLAGENPKVFLAIIALVFVTLYSAMFWVAAFLAVSILPIRYFDRAWLLGLAIPLADLARATVGQAPIALFGGMWASTPLVHFASVGSTFLIALSVCLPVSLIVGNRHISAVVVVALFVGYLNLFGPDPVLPSNVRVAILQHNAEQSVKWTEGYDSVLEEHLFTMARAAQVRGADIIIAPENAITRLMFDNDPFFNRLRDSEMPPLLFGAPANNSTGQLTNTAFLVSDNYDQPARYNKVHLVPGAEKNIWAFSDNSLSLAAGHSRAVFNLPDDLPSIAPLICFDAAFALWESSFSSRPGLLAVITSESLIGKYGTLQALNNSIISAVETGLPVVRSSATGISALIAPDGRVLVRTKFDKRAIRITNLPLPFEPTLFWKYGPRLNYVAMLMIVFASIFTARRSIFPYLPTRHASFLPKLKEKLQTNSCR